METTKPILPGAISIIKNDLTTTLTASYKSKVDAIMFDCGISSYSNPKKAYSALTLWDTGCANSVISYKFAEKIGLEPLRMVDDLPVFKVYIHLPSEIGIPLEITGSRNFPDFDFIAGLDVITKGNFIIDNSEGKTRVSLKLSRCLNRTFPDIRRLKTTCIVSPMEDPVRTKRLNTIWDTGSVFSLITHSAIRKLDLTPLDKEILITNSRGTRMHKIYLVNIQLPGGSIIAGEPVADTENADFEFAIGMGIIQRGYFACNCLNNNPEVIFTSR